jgi:hypothetical protein
MTTAPFYRSKHFLIPLAAIGISLMLGHILSFVNTGRLLPARLIPEFARQGWTIILQVIVFFYLVYYAVTYYNREFSTAPNSAGRYLREILVVFVTGFIIEETFRWLFIRFNVVPESPETLNPKLRLLQMLSMMFLLVIYGIVTSIRIFFNLQQRQLEIIKWQKEFAQSQFEGLKNRLNPHFLFNSLSILSSLVYVDANKAEAFIEKLSRTYRYLLEFKDKDRVELKQETRFLEDYCFLISERFGKKLVVVNEVVEEDCKQLLPPHSLMIALEYIIANNAMSSAKPLQINIKTAGQYLDITYSHHPKTQIESASQEQLNALKERYESLYGRFVEETFSNGKGIIKYPLLKPGEE